MASQEEEKRHLTPAEIKEIIEYNKIIEHHNLVFSGKHPRIKLTAAQIAKNGGVFPDLIEPVKLPDYAIAAAAAQHRIPQLSISSATEPAKGPQPVAHTSGSLNTAQGLVGQVANGSMTAADVIKTLSQAPSKPNKPSIDKRALTGKDRISLLQPSQRNAQTSPKLANSNTSAPSGTRVTNTSAIDYSRDYYHELGLCRDASKTVLYNAFRLLKPITPTQQQAYEILSDDYLRHIYDDARAFSFKFSESSLEVFKEVAKESEEELKVDLSKDYYKLLGVQPGSKTTTDSIMKAFNHKAGLHDPSRVGFRRSREAAGKEQDDARWASIKEAFAVLSNYELRKEYDSGRGIPRDYRPGGGKRSGGSSNYGRRR